MKSINMPKIANPFSNMAGGNNLKKALEEKNRERSKIFGFIGMDVYELYKQKKIDIAELDVYFNQMKELENEIAGLEAEKQRMELQNKGVRTCSCGQPLTAENRFCPKCGKPVDPGVIVCVCGKKVKNDMQFCSYCGRNLKERSGGGQEVDVEKANAPQMEYRTCICGAKVPEGQFMCMECGRKIDK